MTSLGLSIYQIMQSVNRDSFISCPVWMLVSFYSDLKTLLWHENKVTCYGNSNEIILFCSFMKRTKESIYEIYPLVIELVTQSVSFLAIPVSSLGKYLFESFAYFYIGLFVYKSLFGYMICTYFLPVSGLSFCFLNGIFWSSNI